jgi:CubicO group peptidase (beta-lactamase class C family)
MPERGTAGSKDALRRTRRVGGLLTGALLATALVALSRLGTAQTPHAIQAEVDRLFSKWTDATPGCAVGASVDGVPVVLKAYGIQMTPDTVSEAGSVSKQFTAAAVLLLARDGKLSLDDPVRKYIPELPDYSAPLTIRHMLNHTSGLRDWGSVEAIAGWPRTSRAYTQAHVLDIVTRQRNLNFPPGTRWSYTNTGYNLAAIIVSRVSGFSFPEFTRARIFEPVGMTHTSWRDDYTRVVKGRAVAYQDGPDGYHTLMPFENVYGNGGLLTTVGDLLKWNEHFVSPKIGDAAFVNAQQTPGRFNDGRAHGYALGLGIGTYEGLHEVSHNGATAGYRANLVRYPDQHVSVAVLCNVTSMDPESAHRVADLLLADRVRPAPPLQATHALTDAELDRIVGLYRNTFNGVPVSLARDGKSVRAARRPLLVATSGTHFVTEAGEQWDFDSKGGARVTDEFGSVEQYERVPPAKATHDELATLTGTYASNEAEAVFEVIADGTTLSLARRPDTSIKLSPLYADAFEAPQLGIVIFRRDSAGQPIGFSVAQDRVWDLRFERVSVNRRTGSGPR